jgi:L-2-hydroxycarboxylate dehydrogenase (NAD+)
MSRLGRIVVPGPPHHVAQRGEQMPVGWMIDREGKPLTDPKRADEGYLLPIGNYKGSGLSLIIGILANALNRAALGRDVVDFVKETGKATNTRHAIAGITIPWVWQR